ncbi:hypothetical protein RCS94_05395 [Orbaceae bacterium ac157xtp]
MIEDINLLKRSGVLEKDRKKIQLDRKDQNDPKKIRARVAERTAPRRQGRRTSFGAYFFYSLGFQIMFSFLLFARFDFDLHF